MNLVRISAMWCPSCIKMNKYFKEIEEKYADLNITTYDLDMDQEDVKKYNVGNILPVIILFRGEKEIARLVGEKTIDQLVDFIERGKNL